MKYKVNYKFVQIKILSTAKIFPHKTSFLLSHKQQINQNDQRNNQNLIHKHKYLSSIEKHEISLYNQIKVPFLPAYLKLNLIINT